MIPDQARTGEVEVRENGITAYFSVDGENYNFPIKYYGDQWRRFPSHLKQQLGEMVSSLWVATIPADRKIFTHRLDEPDIDVLSYITYQSQNYYRNKADAPSIEGRPEVRVTEGENDWSDIELEHGNCGVYFSGGRDILSTLTFLEDAGYDPHLQMHNNDASWDTGEEARESIQENGKDIDTLWNNRKVVKSAIEKEHNLSLYHVAPRSWMIFFSSLPFLKYDLQIYGNEATTTRYDAVGKNRILHSSWQQSMVSNWMMTRWAQAHGINLRVGSILREMGDYRLTKELVERRPDLWDISHSCFFVDIDNHYKPCSKCHKCLRNCMILEAIGAEHDYDIDRLKEYEMDPAHIQWATLMPDDLSHMNYLNGGWYRRAPSQEIPRMEGLTFEPQRANPAYFLNEDEFLNIYESVMDDDSCWIHVDDLPPEFEVGGEWLETTDLGLVYEIIDQWEFPFTYSSKIKKNTSLLQI